MLCTKNRPIKFSCGSIQNRVPAAPPQLYSPALLTSPTSPGLSKTPKPKPKCNLTKVLGCYNDTDRGSILPDFQPQTHDLTTIDVCAQACSKAAKSVAGIDGGNHCYCGSTSDLSKAKTQSKPVSQCQTMPCRGDRRIKSNCGGENRLIAYSFACTY